MLNKSLSSLLAINFLLIGCAASEDFAGEYRASDIFQVFDINSFIPEISFVSPGSSRQPIRYLGKRLKNSPAEELNNFLIEQTESVDPKENLDLVLEQLVLDEKNRIPPEDRSNQLKRLLLALNTLQGENKCNYYGYIVLYKNIRVIRTHKDSIIGNKNLRRVDKILAHYILEHVRDCKSVYFKRFDEITENFDPEVNRKLDTIFRNAMKNATSDKCSKNVGKSQAERLYNAATYQIDGVYSSEGEDIYDALKELSADDPDAKYLVPIEDERDGHSKIIVDKFNQIYKRYINEPCEQFKKQYGPNVFEIIKFDNQYSVEVDETRPDFYEAWFKYELCFQMFSARQTLVLDYASKLPASTVE